ncbi:hypothetical protein DFQ05_2053 [Winogradskyella wandonensis]|uniref:Uncharacterized protein n=1 Tax=Winogradskyella wandonensis TaxID=1442586 RepID=A0A4R1KRM7_9FLAO|nr:hypothetical protein [Winogradskyella wandonensis]TCK66779.1 hypothetical protein DFQ05_2053 [Winogradskyella wandonensis]
MEPNDKELEFFVDQLMANDALEKPSSDFTNQVLEQLNVKSEATVYKPLISKWVWYIIGFALVSLVIYAFLDKSESTSRLSELLNLSQISFNPLKDFDFNVSQTLIYAAIAFTLMIGLQIPILKTYVDKRLQF